MPILVTRMPYRPKVGTGADATADAQGNKILPKPPLDAWRYARAGTAIVALPLVGLLFGPAGVLLGLIGSGTVLGQLIVHDVVGDPRPGYR